MSILIVRTSIKELRELLYSTLIFFKNQEKFIIVL
jgi:hypothetical protein